MTSQTDVRVRLDGSRDSLSLLSILRAFDGPINEERAWALLHQAAKTAAAALGGGRRCCVVSEPSQLWIHRDGHVHPASFQLENTDDGQTEASSDQSKLVCGLGWMLFEALDYGCKREEQNLLSPDLEQMIDLMTSVTGCESQSTEDEGIERDSGETDDPPSLDDNNMRRQEQQQQQHQAEQPQQQSMTSLALVMERCQAQISSTASMAQADSHFRAVCRALVAETLEFSDFLAKVTSAPDEWKELRSKPEMQCPELTELHLADWAKLWVQVIRQLRNGVKLKKTDSARKPIEYEMTPYEMMMDDIRSRRYKLRSVMVDGQIPPRVKKDAHAVILEFIRSRPPLRKASERTLRPPVRRVSTPVELLMESIRQHNAKELRPTRSLLVDKTELNPTTTKRKLLKADFDRLLLNFDFNQEDDEDLEEVPPGSPPRMSSSFNTESFSLKAELSPALNSHGDCSHRMHCNPNFKRDPSPRRHSIPAISRTQNSFSKSLSHNSHLCSYSQDQRRLNGESGGSLPCSGPCSSASSVSSVSIPSPPGSPMNYGHLQEDFLRSKEFQQVMDQANAVTLQEVMHMRHVLTSASLENLPLDSCIKEDVINGKVCFVCRKTRFSVFGSWWHNCKLCRRTICTKCCTKMRIPSEQFASVPVFTLYSDQSTSATPSSLFSSLQIKLPQFLISPTASSSSSNSNNNSNSNSNNNPATAGSDSSAPSSPMFGRRKTTTVPAPTTAVRNHSALSRRQSFYTPSRSEASALERKKSTTSGTDCWVCKDCHAMMEHIVFNGVHNDCATVHVSFP